MLAYTARGFGASTGQISMNAPDFEVTDARRLIDWLGTQDTVVQDAAGDPRLGIAGGSYGGALALLTAGYDDRVDAVAADITWNDLESSLFGQSAPGEGLGVYKLWWTGSFFGVGLNQPVGGDGVAALPSDCGRFAPDWCRAYLDIAERGDLTVEAQQLMAASSPASITDRITAPTLLGGGQADSLFPLAQVNATAEQIARAQPETPLKVVWHGQGHDGGIDESERLQALVGDWMSDHLLGTALVDDDFEVTLTGGILAADSNSAPQVISLTDYPGLYGNDAQDLPLAGPPQPVRAPAGGAPAAISTFPGLGGGIGGAASRFLGQGLPGQTAAFESEPLQQEVTIAGSSRVTLAVASEQPAEDVVLFASLRVVSASGLDRAPQGLVAPVRLPRIGPEPTLVEVDLPAVATTIAAGDRVRVVVTTTDAAYRLPARQAVYVIALGENGTLSLAALTGGVASGGTSPLWLLIVIPLVLLIVIAVRAARPRTPQPAFRPDLAEVPVSVSGLGKTYKGGVHAVEDVTFTVPPGVVLGLLGPNGAGKTTTMRMLMGLIQPTSGEMHVFGERVAPGAPVLSRVGALVEGAGFLPHLTGRQNLDLYWRAAGRPDDDPHLETALEIAGLGHAIDRKVKSYSQGMRQRLGIAQAMLGYPDLLMLDEPTNGLDPPQIREMRDVLRDYAATGRTVIVSSHLLAEVEMTCTHVVVMHRGRLVAQGRVDELLAGRTGLRLEDVFLEIVGTDRTVGGG